MEGGGRDGGELIGKSMMEERWRGREEGGRARERLMC